MSRNISPSGLYSDPKKRNKTDLKQDNLTNKSVRSSNNRNITDNNSNIYETISIVTDKISDKNLNKITCYSKSPIVARYKTNISQNKMNLKTISNHSDKKSTLALRKINLNREDFTEMDINNYIDVKSQKTKIDFIVDNLHKDINYMDNLLKEYSANLNNLKSNFIKSC